MVVTSQLMTVTFNLIDTTATTINFGGAATNITNWCYNWYYNHKQQLKFTGGLTIGNALTVGASQVIQDSGGVATLTKY